jgi:hypothetical protein
MSPKVTSSGPHVCERIAYRGNIVEELRQAELAIVIVV